MAEHKTRRTRWGSAARANAAFMARLPDIGTRTRAREAAASTELEWLVMPSRYERMSGRLSERVAAAEATAA